MASPSTQEDLERNELIESVNWDPVQEFKSSASKHLHQWVLGGSLCVSF